MFMQNSIQLWKTHPDPRLTSLATNVDVLDFDGSGDYINTWNVLGLEKPTTEQLATYESSAQTEENNNVVIANRKSEYGSNSQQIENIIENGSD